MFGRGKNKKREMNNKPHEIRTLIGEGCVFEGNITSSTSTRIDGQLRGTLAGQNTLVIGEKGVVTGEVKSVDIIIYGVVEGTVEAQRVEIKDGGMITGDIFTRTLVVEDGGIYNGKCFMDHAPANQTTGAIEGGGDQPKQLKAQEAAQN